MSYTKHLESARQSLELASKDLPEHAEKQMKIRKLLTELTSLITQAARIEKELNELLEE